MSRGSRKKDPGTRMRAEGYRPGLDVPPSFCFRSLVPGAVRESTAWNGAHCSELPSAEVWSPSEHSFPVPMEMWGAGWVHGK